MAFLVIFIFLLTLLRFDWVWQVRRSQIIVGGGRHGNKGFFVQPTVFGDVQDQMRICREEIFGPVMQILKFKTIEEAVDRANNSEYGLGSGVFTNNIDSAIEISNNLRAGSVWVNCYEKIDVTTPFGGFKNPAKATNVASMVYCLS